MEITWSIIYICPPSWARGWGKWATFAVRGKTTHKLEFFHIIRLELLSLERNKVFQYFLGVGNKVCPLMGIYIFLNFNIDV